MSACHESGEAYSSHLFKAHVISGKVSLICYDDWSKRGTALFSEYEDVLGRASLFKKSRLNHEEREELLDIFMATTLWTKVYYNWRLNLPDEGDNHLIELAIARNAQYIVTRNLRDFKRAELSYPELNIVSPEDFLKESQP